MSIGLPQKVVMVPADTPTPIHNVPTPQYIQTTSEADASHAHSIVASMWEAFLALLLFCFCLNLYTCTLFLSHVQMKELDEGTAWSCKKTPERRLLYIGSSAGASLAEEGSNLRMAHSCGVPGILNSLFLLEALGISPTFRRIHIIFFSPRG